MGGGEALTYLLAITFHRWSGHRIACPAPASAEGSSDSTYRIELEKVRETAATAGNVVDVDCVINGRRWFPLIGACLNIE